MPESLWRIMQLGRVRIGGGRLEVWGFEGDGRCGSRICIGTCQNIRQGVLFGFGSVSDDEDAIGKISLATAAVAGLFAANKIGDL